MRGVVITFLYILKGGHHFLSFDKGGHVFLWGVLLLATAPSSRNNERSLRDFAIFVFERT